MLYPANRSKVLPPERAAGSSGFIPGWQAHKLTLMKISEAVDETGFILNTPQK